MSLITILIASIVDYFSFLPANMRRFDLLSEYCQLITKRAKKYSLWQGPFGVLALIIPILASFLLVYYLLLFLGPIVKFFITIAVLYFCLGPNHLFNELNAWRETQLSADKDETSKKEQDALAQNLLNSLTPQAVSRFFSVIFWYVVLGIIGAVLYRLVAELTRLYQDDKEGLANSMRDLSALLDWPVVRLIMLSFALVGNFMEVFKTWKSNDNGSIYRHDELINTVVFKTVGISNKPKDMELALNEIAALIQRTLICWLAVISILTLAGWLG